MTWGDVLKIIVGLIGGSSLSILIAYAMIRYFIGHILQKDRDNAIAKHNEDLQRIKNEAEKQLETFRQGHDDMVQEREHLHQEKMKDFDAALAQEQNLFKQSFEKILQEKEHAFAENMRKKTQEADEKLEGLKKEYALLNGKVLAKARVVTPKQIDLLEDLYVKLDDCMECIQKLTSIYRPEGNLDDILANMKKEGADLAVCLETAVKYYRKRKVLLPNDLCEKVEKIIFGQKYSYNLIAPTLGTVWAKKLIQQRASQWNGLGKALDAEYEKIVNEFRKLILE
jgi:hypothetical protein